MPAFRWLVVALDSLVVTLVAVVAWPLARVFSDGAVDSLEVSTWMPITLAAAWLGCLALARAADIQFVDTTAGVKLVLVGTALLFVLAALVSFVAGAEVLRPVVVVAVVVGAPLLVVVRLAALGYLRVIRSMDYLTSSAGLPMIQLNESHGAVLPKALKRLFDIVVSASLLLLLAPLFAVIAIAINVEGPGPVLFIQPRIGYRGKAFRFIKFRSMRADAHLERASVLGAADEDILARYLVDERITHVGRFLRRWSIDELPQLLHVLVGQMSLVGPRPVLVEELSLIDAVGMRRHLSKPGMTGLWQVSGRKEVCWDERIRMDLHYVDSWNLGLDTKILAKTASAVVKGTGAY